MFGKMIRFMRFQKNIKQIDLAEKLGIAGSTLAHYESGYRPVTLETANDIAEICGFEIVFINKKNRKIYKFNDMNQMTYDMRVKDTKK